MKRLCLITALPAETRPLLDAFKLRQIPARSLRLFGNDEFLLLETGLGKLAAAATTGALLQAQPSINTLVNIGIAGGPFPYGQTLVAHQVRDMASGAQWYPHLPDSQSFRQVPSACINTVDKPATDYQEGELFDMEAAGVFHAAARYLSSSCVHSIKIISDNPTQGLEKISKQSVVDIVKQALPTVAQMLDTLKLENFHQHETHSAAIELFIQHTLSTTHHTVSDEQQLRRLVQRHTSLTGKPPNTQDQQGSAADLRQVLERTLTTTPLNYGCE